MAPVELISKEQEAILSSIYLSNVRGYAYEYCEETGISIPDNYINDQVGLAVQHSKLDQNFLNIFREEQDFQKWKPIRIQKFLYKYCTVHQDYANDYCQYVPQAMYGNV